jgi:hypothetical protein
VCRHEDGTGRLLGSSSSVSGGSADLEEEEMFGDMDIDESIVGMRSIPVRDVAICGRKQSGSASRPGVFEAPLNT